MMTQSVNFAHEQRGNRQEPLGYARETLDLSRCMGLVPEQDQAAALVARLSENTPLPTRSAPTSSGC